jgi:16S rRNA (guanine966-N2)-methyltransferase
LDLFAGSGVLAVEGLSRGAATAHLVEKKRPRVDDLKAQLAPLFGDRIRIQCADALQWLEWEHGRQYDLVFVDPPYDTGLQSLVCERLYVRDLLQPNALIYVESRARGLRPVVPHHWQLQKEKISGDICAQLYLQPGPDLSAVSSAKQESG